MKIEILREKENRALGRKEVDFRVEHIGETTPSREDVKSKLVAQFDADKDAVIIKTLNTRFGMGITDGMARIYSEPDQMKKVEREYMIQRHKPKTKTEAS